MTDFELEEARVAVARPRLPLSPSRIIIGLFVLTACLLFAYFGVRHVDETQRELRLLPWLDYDARVDFAYFFAGASMAWHGDAAGLYPVPGEITLYPGDPAFRKNLTDYEKAKLLARGNYYNPPALAFLQAPLTTLSYRDAFWLFSTLSISALGGTLYLAWRAGKGVAALPLLVFGVLAFRPVHEAVIMGHMTLFWVFALTAGLLAIRGRQPVLAGILFSFLALKPQWAVLPGLFLLLNKEWRALAIMAVGSSLIFFVPFMITGLETFQNYLAFLREAYRWDLSGAPHMFSWNGFLTKLDELPGGCNTLDIPPDPKLIYVLIGVTVLPLVAVWRSRDFHLSIAAMILAMLLVSTRSVWYDWALLVVAAVFLVLRPGRLSYRVEVGVILLALYLASEQSMAALLYPDRHDICWQARQFYTLTPVAFASLCWMASVAWREGLLRRPASRPLPPPATGS